MIELHPDRFTTQIIYREDEGDFILGYIAEYAGQGTTRARVKKGTHRMYKGFVYRYRSSVEGTKWSSRWVSRSEAIQELLRHHGKDEEWGHYHIIPVPQTFLKDWRTPDE